METESFILVIDATINFEKILILQFTLPRWYRSEIVVIGFK